ERVRAGDALVGTFLNLGSPLAAEVCALAGFDFVVVDLEHGAGTESELIPTLQALGGRCGAVVRVEAASRPRVQRALDGGADGVMVPRIESAEEARAAVAATNSAELDVRVRVGEAWARVQEGDARTALDLLQHARALAEGSLFSDVDRADVLFRMGVCRWTLSSISTAIQLFDEALALCDRSGLPCDGLRSDIHHWRSRCHRRQRDFEAAREDAERALELAQGVDDRRKMADAYFQASLVAERTGHWVLSRSYAEQAKQLFQELDDERTVGRLLNNLGGLSLLLGKPEQAIDQLKAAFSVALDVDSQADAGQAVNGLATVHLHLGDWEQAAAHARQALQLLEGRDDFLGEIGMAHLMLGRALLELGRLDEAEASFRAADAVFEQHESASHRAGAWVALGDLAARRGDEAEAARLYRLAAETLQDLRF
ncbi:MAG TPA: aldolase/citrate lyase family protein, partial [Gaiellaceae bacterium]|nr:aldolase/citrate lyase family protein [Gaiellaceae bacterium]